MADTPITSPAPDVTRGNFAACTTAAIFGVIAGQIGIAAGDDAWMLLILFALIGPIVPVRLASTKIRLAATALFAVVMVGTMMKDRFPQGPPVWSVVAPPHELVVLVATALSVPLAMGAGWSLSRLYEWWDVQRAMLQSTSSTGPLTAQEQQAMIYDAMNEICDGLRGDYPSMQFEWHRTLSGTDAPASIMFFVVSK